MHSGKPIEFNSNLIPDHIKPIYNGEYRLVPNFGTPLKLTYCFPNAHEINQYWFSPRISKLLPQPMLGKKSQGIFRKGIASWAEVANMTFLEDPVTCDVGIFRLNNTDSSSTLASTTFNNKKPRYIFTYPIFHNKTSAGQYDTVIHEWGHVIGLEHGFGNRANADFVYTESYNTTAASVMNYRSAWSENREWHRLTPAPYDIEAVQMIYGVNQKTMGNDLVKLFNPKLQTKSAEVLLATTLVDVGGNDVLDATGCRQVDLRTGPMHYSICGTNVISLAPNTQFENVIADTVAEIFLSNHDEFVDARKSTSLTILSSADSGRDIVLIGEQTKKVSVLFDSEELLECEFKQFQSQEIDFGDQKLLLSEGITVECQGGRSIAFPGVKEADDRFSFDSVTTKAEWKKKGIVRSLKKVEDSSPVLDCFCTIGRAAALSLAINLGEHLLVEYMKKNSWSDSSAAIALNSAKFLLEAALMGSLFSGAASRLTSYALARSGLLSQKNADRVGAVVGFGVRTLEVTTPLNFAQKIIHTAVYAAYNPTSTFQTLVVPFAANVALGTIGASLGHCMAYGIALWRSPPEPPAKPPVVLTQIKIAKHS